MNGMRLCRASVVVIAAAAAMPVWAINKCIGADGAVQFQDAPCPGRGEQIKVRPAAGAAPLATAPAANTAVQRMTEQSHQIATDRRRLELEIALPNAYAERAGNNAACDQALEALRIKKTRANNNLAGATWEQSISLEMDAMSRRCETRNTTSNANIENMRKECLALGGCK